MSDRLLLPALLGLSLLTGSALAQSRPEAAAPTATAERLGGNQSIVFTVHGGFQASVSRAKQDALQRAQAELVERFQQHQPPLDWTPPTEFIEKRLVRGSTEEQIDDLSTGKVDLGPMWRVHLELELTPTIQREILEYERAHQSERRMGLLARILGVLVTGLVTLCLFIRIDDWTRGFITHRLRVLAIGVFVLTILAAVFVV